MQGLELVSAPAPPDPFKTNPSTPTRPTTTAVDRDTRLEEDEEAQEVVGRAERREAMESSEPRKDAGGAGGASGSGEKPEALPSVGFGELFRFADGLDYVLMTIGSLGAIVHGCSLPLFLRFFADLVNSFGSNANNLDKMMHEVLKVGYDSQSSSSHLLCGCAYD